MTSMLYIAYFKILISREVNVWPVKLFWTSYPGLVLLADVNRVLLSPSMWGAGLPHPPWWVWPHDEMWRFCMPRAMVLKKRKD